MWLEHPSTRSRSRDRSRACIHGGAVVRTSEGGPMAHLLGSAGACSRISPLVADRNGDYHYGLSFVLDTSRLPPFSCALGVSRRPSHEPGTRLALDFPASPRKPAPQHRG